MVVRIVVVAFKYVVPFVEGSDESVDPDEPNGVESIIKLRALKIAR